MDEVFPVEEQDVRLAKDIVMGASRISSRDAVHVAVMRRHGIRDVISFDRGFDGMAGIVRRT